MDGVIVDTEPVHHYAFHQHFKELNIDVSPEMYHSFTGNSTRNVYERLKAHFALEERFMRERSYDQLLQHKNDHERLLDEIRDIMEDFEASAGLDERLLAQRLDAWFSRHFETHDARLHSALGTHPE